MLKIRLLTFLLLVGVAASFPRRRKVPKWNYLLKENQPTEPTTTEALDFLNIPSLDFLIKPEPSLAESKTSKAHQTRTEFVPERNPAGIVKVFHTSQKALKNYYNAIRKMFGGASAPQEEFMTMRREPPPPRREQREDLQGSGSSSSGVRIKTKYGSRPDYDKDNKLKAVVFGADSDRDSILEDERDQGWGVGDAISELFWKQLYDPISS